MTEYWNLYKKFKADRIALQIYDGEELIFASNKQMLAPLLEYINNMAPQHKDVAIFDKIMGNAAALLSIIAGCREVFSPLGSEPAIKTLEKYGIVYHISKVVPFIQKPNKYELCPMEKLSLGKSPEEFYQIAIVSKQSDVC